MKEQNSITHFKAKGPCFWMTSNNYDGFCATYLTADGRGCYVVCDHDVLCKRHTIFIRSALNENRFSKLTHFKTKPTRLSVMAQCRKFLKEIQDIK